SIDHPERSPTRPFLVGGFNLFRRGIPFSDYTRNYVEGATAAFDKSYFNQAESTASKFIDLLESKISSKEGRPWVTFSLLAPADEYGHDDGISTNENSDKNYFESCISTRSP